MVKKRDFHMTPDSLLPFYGETFSLEPLSVFLMVTN